MPRGTPFRSEVLAVPATGFVAAAKNFTIGKANKNWLGSGGRRQGDEWQNAAWDFYDTIGEYRYGVDWVGNLLSKATLYVTRDGERTVDPMVETAMASLFGGPEGQSEMLRQLGIQFTVAGEAFLIGVDDDGEDDWYIIAATEIKRDANGGFTFETGEGKITVPQGKAMSIRIWKPHPRRPKKSTSPTRAVLPVLSEIERLSMHVAAQISSRLVNAGLLILPSQFSFPAAPTTKTNEDGTVSATALQAASPAQSFADLLVEIASIAVDDPADAAAKVPIIAQVDGEYIDKVQLLKFWSDLDAEAINLRKEAIGRLALGLDMPPEVLTGTADTNHWAAWQIDESAIKSHSEPLLAVITSSLTVGYLRPVLESLGMTEEEAALFDMHADTAELRLRPNRSKEAFELWDRGELKATTMRREVGFDEDDAPDDSERVRWLMAKLAQGQTTPELVAEGLRLMGVPLTAVGAPVEDGPDAHEARPTRSLVEHPVTGPPNEGSVPDSVVAAAEMMVFRARERAGNRLKNRLSGRLPANSTAAELYLHLPALSEGEIDAIMEDAWSCIGQSSFIGESPAIQEALDSYTRTIISLRKPHDVELLRSHLVLGALNTAPRV